jgi:hypothetical protein
MSLKSRVDALDGGTAQEITHDEWVWILHALEEEDPVGWLQSSRFPELAPLVEDYLQRHGDQVREQRRLRMEARAAWLNPAPIPPDGGS